MFALEVPIQCVGSILFLSEKLEKVKLGRTLFESYEYAYIQM